MAQFNTINPRTIADELRVIRKALRRIQAHENHEALKALEDVKRMAEEAKSKRIDERAVNVEHSACPKHFASNAFDREGWYLEKPGHTA